MWINGQCDERLDASDRAVQFGDGCFTTARVKNGLPVALTAHITRLQLACERLYIGPLNWAQLRSEMLTAAASRRDGVLKVVISRGAGGRGYSSKGCQQPTRILSVTDYPLHYHALRKRGCRLAVSSLSLARSAMLSGIKHLNRLEQVLIRRELDESGADEILVTDTEGMLVECCAANVFWRKGETVFTPDLSLAGVDGIQRQQVMRLLSAWGIPAQIVSVKPESLVDADEVVITNALMPVLPVKQIATRHYRSRELFEQLTTAIDMDIS